MSSAILALGDAIMASLQSDSALKGNAGANPPVAGLLPPDPAPGAAAGRLAIYQAQFNTSAPIYPSLTFRVSMSVPVKAFEGAFSGLPSAPIDDVRVDFEAWNNVPSSTIALVMDRLEQNFRNQSFSLSGGAIGGANAVCFRAVQLTSIPNSYDAKQQKWFGVASYLFRIQR